ncbi:hypothetical protein HOQ50_gp14 [uncultured phage_MedDCM-OCT-S42-C7]|uniref:Uncharacterized protein n=1 Tax=uncultured phage_MedDCM-OCT-S42-C7 TaxID=2741073 RepID=A0A6S4PAF6_9CAUD|nr:hypothetical protein HOQ50_gp14 [uncultured phage_MedDCM-OCT-S42-C7]BAQ94110.1 hypothetical protein [uncultured phage_MedDCM-OCT-S42-C7]
MCMGRSSAPPVQEAITPVRQAVSSGDELAPTIELASEDALDIAKKKKSKKGTVAMQTDLNIPGSSGTII